MVDNRQTNYQIEEFKDHRPFFHRLDYIDKKLIDTSLDKDVKGVLNAMKELIVFTAAYNFNWEKDYDDIEKEGDKVFSETFYNEKKHIRRDKINEFEDARKKFLSHARKLRAKIYIQLSKAKVNPEATEQQFKASELEEDPDKKEELAALEEIGIK